MKTVSLGNKSMTATNFIWGYNTYRGNWTNSNGFDNLFSTFETATSGNPHPLMLTEWGAPASTHNPQGKMTNMSAQQMKNLVTYLTGHYEDILNHRSDINSGVCCGGAYFEWTDEYWKADPAGKHCSDKNGWAPECHTGIWDPGPNMGEQVQFPGNFWDEEGFGLFAITPVDPGNRKPASPGACIGPWDPDSNKPYPPDTLTMREHANALFSHYKS